MGKLRIPVMVVLFASAALVEAFRLSSLSSLANCDIWWHLSSGLWILQNHSFPHGGVFSQASGQAWNASSWSYEVLLALAYKVLGLRAIPFFLMCLRTGLAVVTFLLAGGRRERFWPAVGLSAITQYVLGAVPPGPVYFSVLFFALELLLLLEARRTGSVRLLWWLVPLFLVWVNVHEQFVYGVAVLLVFLAALAIGKSPEAPGWNVARAGMITGACIVATVCTPYLWGPYAVFLRTTFSSANTYLPEFQALGFRQAQDYLLLLLAMAACLGLGLQRSRDVFQIGLLAACLGLSFYARRDLWLVALAAVAVIGNALAPTPAEASAAKEQVEFRLQSLVAAGAAFTLVLIAAAVLVPRGREALLAKAGVNYPVAASDYVRGHRLAQPLFNAYEWGGFLTWYLPEYPVAIDSRADLYGGDAIAEYSKVMNAEVRYTEYPALADAQTIVLPKNANMAAALASVPRFRVAYSDDVAVVLSRSDAP